MPLGDFVVEVTFHWAADIFAAVQAIVFPATVVVPLWVWPTGSVLPASFATTQLAATSSPASPPVNAWTPWRSLLDTFWFDVISCAVAPAEIVKTSRTISARTRLCPRSS